MTKTDEQIQLFNRGMDIYNRAYASLTLGSFDDIVGNGFIDFFSNAESEYTNGLTDITSENRELRYTDTLLEFYYLVLLHGVEYCIPIDMPAEIWSRVEERYNKGEKLLLSDAVKWGIYKEFTPLEAFAGLLSVANKYEGDDLFLACCKDGTVGKILCKIKGEI